jgi:hypothetical protein
MCSTIKPTPSGIVVRQADSLQVGGSKHYSLKDVMIVDPEHSRHFVTIGKVPQLWKASRAIFAVI